jgi:hypothetical protein
MEEPKLSPIAERALLLHYAMIHHGDLSGLDSFGTDEASRQLNLFAKIAAVSEADAVAAFAELEDRGFIERKIP